MKNLNLLKVDLYVNEAEKINQKFHYSFEDFEIQ